MAKAKSTEQWAIWNWFTKSWNVAISDWVEGNQPREYIRVRITPIKPKKGKVRHAK